MMAHRCWRCGITAPCTPIGRSRCDFYNPMPECGIQSSEALRAYEAKAQARHDATPPLDRGPQSVGELIREYEIDQARALADRASSWAGTVVHIPECESSPSGWVVVWRSRWLWFTIGIAVGLILA